VTKPVVLHPEAEAEIDAAAGYLESNRTGFGTKFRAEVDAAIRQIGATPAVFSGYQGGPVRRYLINRFGYAVYFLELDDVVYVAAVANQRRRPGYWLDRLNDI
jgi:toxin ParE1/3/4